MTKKTGGTKKQRRVSVPGDNQQTVGRAQSPTRFGQSEVLIALALAAVTLAVYAQVLTHQFVSFDDESYIVNNPMVAGGLSLRGIAWAFITFHAANWHPLTWLSHMVDSQLFGLNAGGHLLVNALIHVANTSLLFFFLKSITGATWRSAIVSALFALHPLHVESVAWATERKDTLATFFGLLSLVAYVRYAHAPSLKRYALVTLWLALGLMAKPMLVSWPFVLLLLDYWPLGRLDWRPEDGFNRFARSLVPLVREKLPLFCLVAASMVVTYLAQAHGGAVQGLVTAPISSRLSNALFSYAKYLLLTIWPNDLAFYYPFPSTGIPAWQLGAAVILLAAITTLALRNASRRPYLITGWLWFLGTLVPVIGLMKVGSQAMADRYYYIPSIGLFVALVFGLADLANAWRIGRIPIAIATAVTILLLASLTTLQIGRWRDSETLYTHALSVTSDNFLVQNNLGHVLDRQGKHAEATLHFAEALRIKPDFVDALANMAVTLMEQGKTAEALSFYHRALIAKPDSARLRWQLGLALASQGKDDDALQQFYEATKLAPQDSSVRVNLGLELAHHGKLAEAAEQYHEALRLDPNSAEAHNDLGLVLLMAGQPEKSLLHFSAALRLQPNLAIARDNLQRAQMQISARSK